MCKEDNRNRVLGSLHILFQQEPTTDDERFFQVRQWLRVEGEHWDLVVEHGRTDEAGDLATEIEVLPFFLSTEEALERINGRKGE
jgi:hypothetical protein